MSKRKHKDKKHNNYFTCKCRDPNAKEEIWTYCYYNEKEKVSVYRCIHCGRYLYTC